MMSRRAMCLLTAWLLLGVAAMAQASADPRERKFLDSAHVDAAAHVSYVDDAGHALPFEIFFTRVVAGRSFNMTKDTTAGTVVMAIDPQSSPAPAATPDGHPAGARKDQPLPPLRLRDATGRSFDAATLKGRYALINFLYSECLPCIAEVPALNDFAHVHPDIATVAVTFDDTATAKRFARKWHLRWRLLADGQAFIDAMAVKVYPTMALVSPEGRVIALTTSAGIAGPGKQLTRAGLEVWIDAQKARPRS